VEEKWQEWFAALPDGARFYAMIAAAFVAAFIAGIFLAVWRFVLFGLN
jgi:hypothetical protein